MIERLPKIEEMRGNQTAFLWRRVQELIEAFNEKEGKGCYCRGMFESWKIHTKEECFINEEDRTRLSELRGEPVPQEKIDVRALLEEYAVKKFQNNHPERMEEIIKTLSDALNKLYEEIIIKKANRKV